jgi:hypothetical protein
VPNDARGLTGQVVDLLSKIFMVSSPRMETGVARLTVGGGHGSTAGGEQGLQVAQQVLDGGDQDGSVGVTTDSVGVTTGSGNGAASRLGSMLASGKLAAMWWTRSTGSVNGSAC